MAYRIAYSQIREKHSNRFKIFTTGFFLLFLLQVFAFWPDGAAVLRSAVLAVRNSAAVSALEQFAEALVQGSGAAEAFSDFVRILVT